MARPRINKNWLFLGLAAALGIGAVVLSNSLLKHRMQELDAEAHRGQQTVRVIVASRNLARGQSLTSKDLAIREVPREWVHSTALKPADFDTIQNQRLATALKRGETLLQSHLEGRGATVFSANLKKGWRALTFEVDTVNSISGMLRPGDRIDLIYTGKPVQTANLGGLAGAEEDNVTLPLLSDVTVLATGQTITKHDAQGQPHDFSTITLEVSPLDADRIIVAKDGGHLTALLRHPEDEARNETQLMNKANLVAGTGKGSAAPGPYVEYIVGGSGGGLAKTTTVAEIAPGAGSAR
jgi:pilus assembly protein CpaB